MNNSNLGVPPITGAHFYQSNRVAPSSRPLPGTRQQAYTLQEPPTSMVSHKLADALDEEQNSSPTLHGRRHDLRQPTMLTQLLVKDGKKAPPPLFKTRIVRMPSAPSRPQRQLQPIEQRNGVISGYNTQEYYKALQAAEYQHVMEDDPFNDAAPTRYNKTRGYRQGMAGPSTEVFLTPEEENYISKYRTSHARDDQ